MKRLSKLVIGSLVVVLFFCSCKKNKGKVQTDEPVPEVQIPPAGSTNPAQISKIPMDKFIGVNGFHEDNVEFMQAAGTLRAYCNWDWFQGDNAGDQLIFQNSRGGWYFDDAFKKIKESGITVSMCFQGAIKNLQGTKTFKFNDKPVDRAGLSTTDPKSYQSIANTLYQIAARYGKTTVAPEKLNVPANQKQSGLDLLEYMEVWNEQDKTWEGDNAKFSPQEYAAMLSACYDKIKEADPKMKVVMGGLATLSVDYVKAMNEWFKANRPDKKFAADVVNAHIYAFANNIDFGNPTGFVNTAETPEDGKLKEKTKALVDYAKANIPNAEVWISEFGWDTNPKSVLSPRKLNALTMNELQGRYIIRGYLAFAAAGVDQAQLFELSDPSQNYIDTWFGTAGLLDRTLNFAKKPSWFYTSTLKNTLKNMVFIGEQTSGDPNILIYKFKNMNNAEGVYAVWYKTRTDATKADFQVQLSATAKSATKIELADKSITGTQSNLVINKTMVTANVSERPIFIKVDAIN